MHCGSDNLIIMVGLFDTSKQRHLAHEYQDPNTAARKPENAIYMEATKIQSVQIMQPQYRNRHSTIFGGYLLKSTFELAFTCASAVSHSRPKFIALDPSTFENPVPIGSVLYLTATVAYTDSPLVSSGDSKASPEGTTRIQVRVDSKVRNIEHGETKPTGQFNYTFEVEKDVKIIPQTYSQFMMYLDARRRTKRVARDLDSQPSIASTGSTSVME
jgi:acyl-coenzyme A thioesterase 9